MNNLCYLLLCVYIFLTNFTSFYTFLTFFLFFFAKSLQDFCNVAHLVNLFLFDYMDFLTIPRLL